MPVFDPKYFKKNVIKYLKIVLSIGLLYAVALTVFSDKIVLILLGEKFEVLQES